MGRIKYNSGRILFPIVIILSWEMIYSLVGQPGMASPFQSLTALTGHWAKWLGDLSGTLRILLISFGLSAAFGVLLGFIIGMSRFWTETVLPIVLAAYSIPKITLYPIFLVIFGISDMCKIAFSFIHGFFPIFIICMEATRMIPNVYLKLSRSFRLSFRQKVFHVLIPSIIPQLVIGLRLGFSLNFIGLILAEMFASYKGVGTLLIHYTMIFDTSSVFALFLIIVFIAFLATFIFVIFQEQREHKIGKSLQINAGH